ncbi:MerR family transcriptional regulator [Alicyclobacillus macrosporangiidus]|uniref:MerR family transcriptional regulator n=1 Tax=Alicyclobacillus macrosporangiidus TaxID=392015 RepID=UPI000498585A|nr:MerR family transcriptional regulator [Alicyclobacillus macrosporangiidus]
MGTDANVWRVGEVADLTGLSVRTLHYYEEMGLLVPSDRTETGHRRYTEADLARLQQILSLKSIGFSLEEIRDCLNNPDFSPLTVLNLHMDQIRRHIEALMELHKRLETVADHLRQRESVSAQEFIYLMEGIRMAEKYPFTPEQMEKIRKQGELLGQDKIREVEQEWPELIAKVKAEMEKGTPPDSPEVRQLARRWKELIEMFTGGDPGIAATLKKRYTEEPGYAAQFGMSRELLEYVAKAMES